MNVLNIIQIALLLPFLCVLATLGIIYLVNGYKKDLGRSLVSFAATVVAIGVSLLFAKLISAAVAGKIMSFLPEDAVESLSEIGTLGNTLVQAAVEIVLSFVLFGLIFVIILAILKAVGKKISLGKIEELNTGKSGTRLAGMGIRGIDAILVSVMLLLPLYGTIATVVPPAATLMHITENFPSSSDGDVDYAPEEHGSDSAEQTRDDTVSIAIPQKSSIYSSNVFAGKAAVVPAINFAAAIGSSTATPEPAEILDTIANHPVLLPYKYGPGSWVYSDLSSVSMNGSVVDICASINSLDGVLSKIEACIYAVEQQDISGTAVAVQDLIEYLRSEVIYQRWSYNMVMAIIGELDASIESSIEMIEGEEELSEVYGQIRPLLDLTFEEYTHNADGVLEFVSWGVNWFIEAYGKYDLDAGLPDEEKIALINEACVRLGDLLNHSEQTRCLKRIVFSMLADTMFDTLPDPNDPANADYYSARKNVPNSGVEFVNKYLSDSASSEEEFYADGVMFMLMMSDPYALGAAAVFAYHPSFGADAVLEAMDEHLYINGIDMQYISEKLAESDNAEEIYRELDNKLRACENAPALQLLEFSNEVFSYLAQELDLVDDSYSSWDDYFDSDYIG